ncbi:MAG: hypothetical protein WA900_05320 [Casimicrobiaceae bacterium]
MSRHFMPASPRDGTGFESRCADDLAQMWRESFEHGVGVIEPRPTAQRRHCFLEEVAPTFMVRVALEGDESVGFIAADRAPIAALDRRAQVKAFHEMGLAAGGRDNGRPAEREYHPGYYAAFVLAPDGNNIEAVFHGGASRAAPSVVVTPRT